MTIRLEAIKFNHNSSSFSSDALNLRKNGTQFIQVPEWQRGFTTTAEQSVAAYAIKETTGQPLTIRAKFSSSDPLFGFEVRALDVGSPEASVLGDVPRQTITLGFDTQTGFEPLTLRNPQLSSAGVGVHLVTWRWQARLPGAEFTDIGESRHQIYTVLEAPKAPWAPSPSPLSNIQLPWVDVLDIACRWASGATNADQAATMITRRVFELGLTGVIQYDKSAGDSHYTRFNEFLCERFLQVLRGEGLPDYKLVNCTDCAMFVSTFANALGCELSQSRMGTQNFDINAVQLIGFSEFEPSGFSYHEVAWKGACTASDEVFDACLQLDSDSDPLVSPFTPLLATNLRFGEPGQGLYRDMLARSASQHRLHCAPIQTSRIRRLISNPSQPDLHLLIGNAFAERGQRFGFEDWPDRSLLPHDLLAWNFQLSGRELPGWQLLEKIEGDFASNAGRFVETLWGQPDNDEKLLRVKFYESTSRQQAHRLLVELLGLIALPGIAPLDDPIGDVSFSLPSRVIVLFARANLAVSVYEISPEPESVLEIAATLDHALTFMPDHVEEVEFAPETHGLVPLPVRRGHAVRLLLNAPSAKRQAAAYKFFSRSGRFQVIEGYPCYIPADDGQQEVSVYPLNPDDDLEGVKYQFSM
ncbi:MAG: hypothetical protein WBV94_29130 [Blastocatellia bacterium]